jgi:hypothetical protein
MNRRKTMNAFVPLPISSSPLHEKFQHGTFFPLVDGLYSLASYGLMVLLSILSKEAFLSP